MLPLSAMQQNRLTLIDGLRGIAAMWIVLFHLIEGKHIEHLKTWLSQHMLGDVLKSGEAAVAIFFVVSGFVMAFTVQRAMINEDFIKHFLLRRLIRLTPPYYIAIVFTLVLLLIKSTLLNQPNPDINFPTLAAHLVYIQGILGLPHLNIVYWTLCIEIQFYLCFALLLYAANFVSRDQHTGQLWLFGGIGLLALGYPIGIFHDVFWTASFIGFWFSYMSGVLVCWGATRGGKMLWVAKCYCLALLLIGGYVQTIFVIMTAFIASLLLIANLKGTEKKWLSWSGIQFLGMISYSLYLLHNPITGLSFRILHKIFPEQTIGLEIIEMGITLTLCLVIAWLAYHLIERPSIQWSRCISLQPRPAT